MTDIQPWFDEYRVDDDKIVWCHQECQHLTEKFDGDNLRDYCTLTNGYLSDNGDDICEPWVLGLIKENKKLEALVDHCSDCSLGKANEDLIKELQERTKSHTLAMRQAGCRISKLIEERDELKEKLEDLQSDLKWLRDHSLPE